jgi:hypothetical protein
MKIHIHQHETLKYIENVEWSNFGSLAKSVPLCLQRKTTNLKALEKDKCNENLMLFLFEYGGLRGWFSSIPQAHLTQVSQFLFVGRV